VLLIGHRGAVSATCPENTLAAVDRAMRLGADGVEIDVQLTSDGVVICHHDPDLARSTGEPRAIGDVRWAELPLVAGHRIPTLSQVLELVGDRGQVVVELKTRRAAPAVAPVAAVLRRHRLDQVVVSSFHRGSVQRLRREDVPVRTALLGRPGLALPVLLKRAQQDGHEQVHPHVNSLVLRPDLVPVATALGIDVVGWTVNQERQLALLAAAGVCAAICDEPQTARALLASHQLARTG
jgi:glycerophosphoryl diester phosphodiesterase